MRDQKRAIFIGGCSRSGTTMLGALLGASPDCVTTPESQFKWLFFPAAGGKISYNQIQRDFRLYLWSVDFSDKMDLGDRAASLMFNLVSEYARSHLKNKRWRFWVDHTPNNLKYSVRLREEFEECKFIHIIRDGRAVSNSVMPLTWGPNNIIAAGLWWQAEITPGLVTESTFPEDTLRVRYEDLIRNPRHEVDRICNFCGIEAPEDFAMTSGFQVPSYTRTQHQKVGSRMDPGRIDSWTESLTAREVEIFEYLTGDLLSLLGYKKLFPQGERPPSRVERWRLGEIPQFSFARLRNRVLHSIRQWRAMNPGG